MTTPEYAELYRLAVAGATSQASGASDMILARPAQLFRSLYRALPPIEAGQLFDALAEVNKCIERKSVILDPVEAAR